MPSKPTAEGPLSGRTVLVTRAPEQAGLLSELLRAAGAEVIELPTIRIVAPTSYDALDAGLRGLDRYAMLVLGSKNAAERTAERAGLLGLTIGKPVACVGEKTAAALDEPSLAPIYTGPRLVPASFRAEAMVETIVRHFEGALSGLRFLHPRAPEGREQVSALLGAAGAVVDGVEAYRIQPAERVQDPALLERVGQLDALTFLSGETLAAFLQILPEREARRALDRACVAVIGPVARARAEALGVRVDLMPESATIESLVGALSNHLRR